MRRRKALPQSADLAARNSIEWLFRVSRSGPTIPFEYDTKPNVNTQRGGQSEKRCKKNVSGPPRLHTISCSFS